MNDYAKFLKPNDCILLLVDFQKTLLDFCIEQDVMRKNAGALIDAAHVFGIPSLFTSQNAERLGGALPELLEKVPRPVAFDKIEFSCFDNPAIAKAIGDSGRRTILLTGMETHICAFHTGVDALHYGYRVHVAADAVTSRSAFNREIGLRRLEKAGAVISSTEMIIYELLNRAGTDSFRALLPLLKTF
jgi:nicotinamidase-related amidase